MNILLSNDDGIFAEGLRILWRLLKELGHNIFVVAPHRQHSGASHTITLSKPLRVKKIKQRGDFFGTAVYGSPADAVKLGLSTLCPSVDIVVSGINLGPNAGPSVYYSGTVAAAFEGMAFGKTALAFSFDSFCHNDLPNVEGYLRPFLPQILKLCASPILYNINIPNTASPKGILITRQFRGYFLDKYERYTNWLGKEYYAPKEIGFTPENPSANQQSAIILNQPTTNATNNKSDTSGPNQPATNATNNQSDTSVAVNPTDIIKAITSVEDTAQTISPSSCANFPHDVTALLLGYISITPLQFDLTSYSHLKQLNEAFEKTT